MQTADALSKARLELDALGLNEWELALDRAKRRLGQTRYNTRTIGLSRDFLALNEWDIVRNTVLHEAAHALVGPGNGHNATWKRQARAIGCTAVRCSMGAAVPEGTYNVVCPKCGILGQRFKRASRLMSCRRCRSIVRFERRVA